MSQLLTPKFLTKEMAEKVIGLITSALRLSTNFAWTLKLEEGFHIVILVPAMELRGGIAWPNYEIHPHALCEWGMSKKKWKYPLDEIAQCKALQLWHGRNDGRTDIMPHLLFPNDTPFWGGVKRDGIVVTCSGLEPCFDRMLAGMIADMCIALAYNAWMTSKDRKKDVAFLA